MDFFPVAIAVACSKKVKRNLMNLNVYLLCCRFWSRKLIIFMLQVFLSFDSATRLFGYYVEHVLLVCFNNSFNFLQILRICTQRHQPSMKPLLCVLDDAGAVLPHLSRKQEAEKIVEYLFIFCSNFTD